MITREDMRQSNSRENCPEVKGRLKQLEADDIDGFKSIRYLSSIWDEFSQAERDDICHYAARRLKASEDGEETCGQLAYLESLWGTISEQDRLQLIRDALDLSELSDANGELGLPGILH